MSTESTTVKPTATTTTTVIGVDPGVNNVAVAAPADADQHESLVVDGSEIRDRFHKAYQDLEAAAEEHDPSWPVESEIICELGKESDQLVNAAVDEVLDYCQSHPQPVIALEQSDRRGRQSFTDVASYSRGPQLGEWLIPTFNRRLIAAADDAGIRLERVSGDRTSTVCHSCDEELNSADERLVQCANERCHVDTLDRDRNAAIVLARRLADSSEVSL